MPFPEAWGSIAPSLVFDLTRIIRSSNPMMPVLSLAALVLLPITWPRFRIGRIEGGFLLAGFSTSTALTLVRGA